MTKEKLAELRRATEVVIELAGKPDLSRDEFCVHRNNIIILQRLADPATIRTMLEALDEKDSEIRRLQLYCMHRHTCELFSTGRHEPLGTKCTCGLESRL